MINDGINIFLLIGLIIYAGALLYDQFIEEYIYKLKRKRMYTDKKTGQRYDQTQINRYIGRACKLKHETQRENFGYNFCENCGKNSTSTRLDCSHIKSRQKCKNDGEIEKLWDLDNLQLYCRDCHKKFDGLNLQFGENGR